MIIKPAIPGFSFSKLTYAELVATLPFVPGATLHDLGESSAPGKNIYAFSKGDIETKPVIFILGALHGQHEWRGAYIVREFFRMLNNYDKYPHHHYVAELLETFAFYGIVCANPYGYENDTRGNANLVDLNRNFSPYWEQFVNDIPNGYDKGTAPFSEIETQIVRDKVLEIKPVAFVDLHIYGNSSKFVCVSDTAQFKDLEGSLERTIGMQRLQNYGAYNLPMAHLWARTVDTKDGRKCNAWLFEPGANETEFSKSVIGLNGLFLFAESMRNWYKTNSQRNFNN